MERLELSKPKLLGPKSSAVTNFATSVIFMNLIRSNMVEKIFLKIEIQIFRKIYFSSTYILQAKLVDFPRSIDFAKERDFCAALHPFLFQFAFRAFFFDFDVRFLGTAIFDFLMNNSVLDGQQHKSFEKASYF